MRLDGFPDARNGLRRSAARRTEDRDLQGEVGRGISQALGLEESVSPKDSTPALVDEHRGDVQTHLPFAHDRRLRAHRSAAHGRRTKFISSRRTRIRFWPTTKISRMSARQSRHALSAIDRPHHPQRDEDAARLEDGLPHSARIEESHVPPDLQRARDDELSRYSFEPISTKRFVRKTRPAICSHSETIFPTT